MDATDREIAVELTEVLKERETMYAADISQGKSEVESEAAS
jgi:hypothetical protein